MKPVSETVEQAWEQVLGQVYWQVWRHVEEYIK